MLPENSAASSHDDANTPTRAPAKAQIVFIDSNAKAMSLFGSEQKPPGPQATELQTDLAAAQAGGGSSRPSLVAPAREAPHRADVAARPPAARPFASRGVIVAALALAVLAQGGYIAYGMWRSDSFAPAPETGSVNVTSDPIGAPVVIDGTARGETPLTVALPPGAHDITVGTAPNVRSQTVTVARGGDFSLHLALAAVAPTAGVPGTGSLQVATEPAGARVWIDGEPRGVAPVTITNLKAGDHAITVRGNSGEAVNRTVSVQEGAVASLVVTMNAGGSFTSGWLALTSGVPLQILERGTVIGTTDTPRMLLPTGSHDLELVNAELGYRVTRTVQITAGQTTSVALKPPMGTISINAVPWAEIFIDGQGAGETPIGNLSIPIGRHELVFRHPELGEQRRTVTVGVTSPQRVSADMRKP